LPSRLRILISAYGCGPGRGSEPGVGWNWSRQIARFHDVWVLTPESERSAIENYEDTDLPANLHFVHCDLPAWVRPCNQGTTIRYHLHYHLWQILAFFVVRRLHRRLAFDFVHHLTLGAHWKPSFLALLPIPFIWGPVGGGELTPKRLSPVLSRKGRLFEMIRAVRLALVESDPFVKITARRAQIILAKTEETAARVRRLGGRHIRVISEAGLPEEELHRLTLLPAKSGAPFRFLSMGRVLYWKGFEIGIRAFARLCTQLPETEFWIVGDGPELPRLRRVAEEVGVASKLRFLGGMPRTQALEVLSECDVLVHPSLHDSGGWVCLEAMAAARPVICLNTGGPALQVTSETGIKIAPESPDETIEETTKAMYSLATNRDYMARLGLAAHHHVNRTFNWEKRGPVLARLYSSARDYSQNTNLIDEHAQLRTPPAAY
jgi:glycosyltransferase involved in cell wall biosynthesis